MIGSLSIQSCKKGVENVNFDINYEQKTYAVGEPIKFNVTGGAELITFYSGEVGREYKYRERFQVDGKASLEFTSSKLYAPLDAPISLLVSTNFNGTYDVESLQKATWTDISDRTTFSATGGVDVNSGIIDLSDFQQPNVPVYVAFRYNNPGVAYYAAQYVMKNFLIVNKINDGSTATVETSTSLDWGPISVTGVRAWAYSTTQVSFWGGTANTEPNEDWLVSKPLLLDRVQRSLGVNVKNNPTSKLATYEFAGFSKPGTYTVTFEGINSNVDKIKKEIKEFTITVI